MSLLEKAKQLFTGDNETPKNIPEAFRLLDELIEQNNIDAIKLKLQFLSQIGNQSTRLHLKLAMNNLR